MREPRYYISSVTGYRMETPDQRAPTTEFSIHDRAFAHRRIAIFSPEDGHGEAAGIRAHKRCYQLNREEERWEGGIHARPRPYSIRFTDDERDACQAAADVEGTSLAIWARATLLNAALQPSNPTEVLP